jgi:preprotein translocase subunit SecB
MSEPSSPTPVVFALEKIYVKDSSYEAPNAPQVFLDGKAPEVGVQLAIDHGVVAAEQSIHEVVLSVTVTARHDDKTVFLAEVHQAGLFRIQNVPGDDLPKVLEIACPNVLLPFVRQAVNDLVEAGGFPQLLINPVNFEALYLQKHAAATPPAH